VTGLKKRSVVVAGHRTSVSLEAPFWDELARLARAAGVSVNALIAEIDRDRDGNLSSAIRVYVLNAVQRERTSSRDS
jgi:predicted DNA-binding ribbon-helix-helix protein